ncbi:hypothetical protein N0V83_009497 [Neocucurbitaria cava]|uniref:Protein kinase domain-containing protein n=1 Tax=Neocucurbitaria cava TaxID=798079 RepID=A0A9W8Y0P3_9PLEO|nr:hypothetical protein N0V83_009497 [Neocucurbitaria cava]
MFCLDYSHEITEPDSLSNSRSSRAPVNGYGALQISEGLEAYGTQSSASGTATVVEVFVAALHKSNLPGPVILIDETAERIMVGRGSQFVIYRQRMAVPELTQFSTRTVAVKVPRFSLNPKAPLRLAGTAAQKHIHDMYLEVLALTNPIIRSHPYVARLLAWSYDAYTMNTPLYLVMELAECSLRSFLQNPVEGTVSHSLRYDLCRNVAAGVDVLHECGLIHGDLKTDNILIFRNRKGAYVAKVADFGLSVAEAVSGVGPVSNVYIGGTLGWQAPEVEQARTRDLDRMSLYSDGSNMTDFVDCSFNKVHHDGPYYSWETPTMAQVFIRDLYARMMEVPESTAPEMLFSMFLVVTAWPKLLTSSWNQGLDILLLAANRGSTAARGIVDSVVTYYGLTLQEEVEAHLFDWRRTAALSGSILAQRALACHDPSLLQDCVKHFRDRGGYATLYGTFDSMRQTGNTSSGTSYSRLHELATYGTPVALEAHLRDDDASSLDALTDEGETSVYLACARGSWEILEIFLGHGADCRIPCTQWDITCLHWAFAFDEHRQADAVSCLIAAGVDVNALVRDATPFPHYPFILPPGTALHWAVVTRSHTVIESLLQNGVDVSLRDGCDMYVYDDRIRILDKFGGPNMEAYSIPKGRVKGLSALDYAAMAQDPFIFDVIGRMRLPIDINNVDEEGLSVLHRLSTDPKRRTRTGNAFCDKVFRGAPPDTNKDLRHIIKVIVDIGGDLELLTTPSAMVSEHNDSELTLPCYTPLMMAALGTSVELVEALLQAGARVDAVNDKGQTALMCISEDREAAATIIPVLIAHGANVNHVDKSDATPILLASGPRSIDTVDLLLCKGADIDSRVPYREDEHGQGRGIFGLLPRQDDPFNDEADLTIRGMLEKYVFACPDIAKKRRVIDKGDIDGRTLLHQFARSGMPRCVQALLSNNAPLNALDYIYRRDHDQGKDVKLSWFETPLDSAFVARERKIQEMQRESVHTLEENEDILTKIDRVIFILQEAGGICTRHQVKSEPFLFDQSKFGKRGFVKALRESGSGGTVTVV